MLIFNYAYEVVGTGLVSDAIYEYGINNLRELKAAHPNEWNSHPFYKEYFVDQDDWEYTGSGVPRTEGVKMLYEVFLTKLADERG